MIRVILESPFAGTSKFFIIRKFQEMRNIRYARKCVRDSLSRGEAPIASHLLYTQKGVLKDDIQEERIWGIEAGLAWKSVADKHVFYIDYGISRGMEYGMQYATDRNIKIVMRHLYKKESKK